MGVNDGDFTFEHTEFEVFVGDPMKVNSGQLDMFLWWVFVFLPFTFLSLSSLFILIAHVSCFV